MTPPGEANACIVLLYYLLFVLLTLWRSFYGGNANKNYNEMPPPPIHLGNKTYWQGCGEIGTLELLVGNVKLLDET